MQVTDWPKATRERRCLRTGKLLSVSPAWQGAKPIRQSDIDRYGSAQAAREEIYGEQT